MTKDLYERKLSHNKLYLCSRNLERPVVYVQEEALNVLKDRQIENFKQVFSNEYHNEYLGQVLYKEYNTIRLNGL